VGRKGAHGGERDQVARRKERNLAGKVIFKEGDVRRGKRDIENLTLVKEDFA